MAPPQIRKFQPGDRMFVRAQQIWVILIAHVMHTSGPWRNRLLEYGELMLKMGRDPRAAVGSGRELGIVGEYCILNDLPALNCLVVNHHTGTPGFGVVSRPGKKWQDEVRDALKVDWFQYRIPTTGTFRQVTEQSIE